MIDRHFAAPGNTFPFLPLPKWLQPTSDTFGGITSGVKTSAGQDTLPTPPLTTSRGMRPNRLGQKFPGSKLMQKCKMDSAYTKEGPNFLGRLPGSPLPGGPDGTFHMHIVFRRFHPTFFLPAALGVPDRIFGQNLAHLGR